MTRERERALSRDFAELYRQHFAVAAETVLRHSDAGRLQTAAARREVQLIGGKGTDRAHLAIVEQAACWKSTGVTCVVRDLLSNGSNASRRTRACPT